MFWGAVHGDFPLVGFFFMKGRGSKTLENCVTYYMNLSSNFLKKKQKLKKNFISTLQNFKNFLLFCANCRLKFGVYVQSRRFYVLKYWVFFCRMQLLNTFFRDEKSATKARLYLQLIFSCVLRVNCVLWNNRLPINRLLYSCRTRLNAFNFGLLSN